MSHPLSTEKRLNYDNTCSFATQILGSNKWNYSYYLNLLSQVLHINNPGKKITKYPYTLPLFSVFLLEFFELRRIFVPTSITSNGKAFKNLAPKCQNVFSLMIILLTGC